MLRENIFFSSLLGSHSWDGEIVYSGFGASEEIILPTSYHCTNSLLEVPKMAMNQQHNN